MKLSDFFMLTAAEKKLILLHEGILIAKRSDPAHMVFLFQLDDYYVETFCNWTNKEVDEFRVFTNTETLTPYLEAISIDDLLY